MAYETPVFNLRAVARETGVNPSTLRAWERRYGLPQPERTEGGHRLYSQRDIDLIKWLLARRQEGMRIKSAVELWRQLGGAGQGPLRPVAWVPQVATPPEGTIAELRQAWTSACLAFDERGAEQLLTQAFALYPPETVSLELLQRGLAQFGEGWFRGEVTVQQEHFASTLATRRLDALVESTPPPTRPGRILTACSPQERHAFSLLLLTFLLRRCGWGVLFLGADVPTARLEKALATTRPQLVILAAQQLHTAATLKEMAQLLRREHIPVGYGGRIFNLAPALRQRIPGHFLGHSVAAAPLMVEQLMGAPHPVPPIEPSSKAHRQALAHFRERQPLIEVHLLQTLAPMGIAHGHLVEVNKELAGNIAAALSLGNVSLLGIYFDWLEGVCSGDRLPAQLCAPYLQAYYRSAKAHLDGRGALITDWLAERIGQGQRS